MRRKKRTTAHERIYPSRRNSFQMNEASVGERLIGGLGAGD